MAWTSPSPVWVPRLSHTARCFIVHSRGSIPFKVQGTWGRAAQAMVSRWQHLAVLPTPQPWKTYGSLIQVPCLFQKIQRFCLPQKSNHTEPTASLTPRLDRRIFEAGSLTSTSRKRKLGFLSIEGIEKRLGSFPNVHAGKAGLLQPGSLNPGAQFRSGDPPLPAYAELATNSMKSTSPWSSIKPSNEGFMVQCTFPNSPWKTPTGRQKMPSPAGSTKSFIPSSSWKSEKAVQSLVKLLGFF